MRAKIEAYVDNFIGDYCNQNGVEHLWTEPLIRYASVDSPVIRRLKTLVGDEHLMPEEFLENAKSILSYFLPFKENVAKSNIGGDISSPLWAEGYLNTNKMAVQLNLYLVEHIKDLGYDAVSPGNPGRIDGKLYSNWSQRHIAYAAGHGSFGLNNMLITEKGCSGRFFSVITTLPFADEECTEERCLYKRNGKCRLCVVKCVNGSLTTDNFDRKKCSLRGQENKKIYSVTTCGKCVAGMPCANKIP